MRAATEAKSACPKVISVIECAADVSTSEAGALLESKRARGGFVLELLTLRRLLDGVVTRGHHRTRAHRTIGVSVDEGRSDIHTAPQPSDAPRGRLIREPGLWFAAGAQSSCAESRIPSVGGPVGTHVKRTRC